MRGYEEARRSLAVRPSWAALGLAIGAFAVAAPLASIAAPAAESASGDVGAELQALRAETEAQKSELQQQQNELEQLRMELQVQTDVLKRAGLLNTDVVTTSPTHPQSGVQMVANQPPTAAPAGDTGQGGASAERPKSERQADQLLVDVGGVLLPRWYLQLEPGIDETHASNPRVNIFGYTIFNAINFGTIRVDEVQQDVANASFSARMGLPFRTQIDIRAPYTFAFSHIVKGVGAGNPTNFNTDGIHVGDLSTTFSWQPIAEHGWIPAVVLRMRGTFPTGQAPYQIPLISKPQDTGAEKDLTKSPTGAGYFAYEPGFTLVWRSDPLVMFVGGSYGVTLPIKSYTVPLTTINCDQATPPVCTPTVSTFPYPRLNVGDIAGFNAGVNFAVNERASLNFSFVDLFQGPTMAFSPLVQKGPNVWHHLPGTTVNDARLGIGASFGLTDRVTLVVNAGMGLTDQSPGYTFGISLPITLPLRKSP